MKIIRDKGIIENASAPTTADVYRVGTIWVDTTNDVSYTLTDVTAGVSTWLKTAGIGSGSIDLEGDYLLNDQTTTNMMSKGTVFHTDGVDDFIAMDALAVHLTNTNNTKGYIEWSGILHDVTGVNLAVWSFSDTNAGRYIRFRTKADGTLHFDCALGSEVLQWDFTTDNTFSSDTQYCIRLVQDGTTPVVYVNGIPQALTFTTSTDTGAWFSDVVGIDNGRLGCRNFASGGNSAFSKTTVSAFKVGNFAPTASEIKDFSGNIPFKWQYGSQTDLVTNGAFAADTDWTLIGANSTIAAGVCNIVGTVTNDGYYQPYVYEIGQTYRVTFDINSTDATGTQFGVRDGTNSTTNFTTTGTKTVEFVADGTYNNIRFLGAGGATTVIDNVSMVRLGAVALYTQDSITANNWFDLANGNTGAVTGAEVLNPKGISTDEDNIPNFSVTSGITADTGSAQGNGVLTASINQISVCGNAGDAVTLPAAKPGKVLWVFNDGANASDCFPASGDNIDEAGANTALSIAVDAEVQFICTSAGHWSTITSA